MLAGIEVDHAPDEIEHLGEFAGLGAGIEPPRDRAAGPSDVGEGLRADLGDHLLEAVTDLIRGSRAGDRHSLTT
jgi:hypothetical protein